MEEVKDRIRGKPSGHLRKWYRFWNEEYFGNKLPDIQVFWANLPKDELGRTEYRYCVVRSSSGRVIKKGKPLPVRIMLSNRLNKDWLRRPMLCVLLHEMTHVCLPKSSCDLGFRSKFYKKIMKIANDGALTGIL